MYARTMTTTTSIPTDLVTPLGAYLALRSAGGASFLLESVEKGRLGRHSLVGTGSRLVSFDEAEAEVAAGRPVVGYLGYDHVARLEPTVPLPEPGPDLPESRFVVADTLVRFDHARATAEVLAGDRDAVAALLDWPVAPPPEAAGAPAGRDAPRAGTRDVRGVGRGRQAGDRRGRGVPDRPLPARRAADRGLRRRALPGAAPGEPLPLPLPARARRPRARRLLARDARQARRAPGEPQPDRRDDRGRRGRRRAAARVREGPGRARDARRPGPQRPLARLQGRDGARRPLARGGALFARHAPRLGGGRASSPTDGTPSTCSARASRRERCPARRRCARCS